MPLSSETANKFECNYSYGHFVERQLELRRDRVVKFIGKTIKLRVNLFQISLTYGCFFFLALLWGQQIITDIVYLEKSRSNACKYGIWHITDNFVNSPP